MEGFKVVGHRRGNDANRCITYSANLLFIITGIKLKIRRRYPCKKLIYDEVVNKGFAAPIPRKVSLKFVTSKKILNGCD